MGWRKQGEAGDGLEMPVSCGSRGEVVAGPIPSGSGRAGEPCVLSWLRGRGYRRCGAFFQAALSFPLGNLTHGLAFLYVLFFRREGGD